MALERTLQLLRWNCGDQVSMPGVGRGVNQLAQPLGNESEPEAADGTNQP